MTRARALALAALVLGCAGPIVEDEVHQLDPKTLVRIAVVPFLPAPNFIGSGELARTGEAAASSGSEGAEAAAVVTRIASEALSAAGFDVIPASDVEQLFEAAGKPLPLGDEAAFASAVAREFGATSALFGIVHRYRERHGGEFGATRPASVRIELALHEAPGAGPLWTARFDHTQQALSENALVAHKYPGAGSRWMSAAELTRWGLDAAAKQLAELR